MNNFQWLLAERPTEGLTPKTFRSVTEEVKPLKDGEYLVKNQMLSCDPTQIMWMQRATYVPMIEIGSVVRSLGVGKVVESRNSKFSEGDQVQGLVGWQEYAVLDDHTLFPVSKIPQGIEVEAALSIFGMTGLTAYQGMKVLGQPQPNQTVLVSGAAGATGSIAAQIGRIAGSTVIGVAGSDEKCAWLRDRARIQHTINYRTDDFATRLQELAPQGIDLYFDNVGGSMLNATLNHLAVGAKVLICGAISTYVGAEQPTLSNYMQLVMKRATMQGFLVSDFFSRAGEATQQFAEWLKAGELMYEVDVQQGLGHAPEYLARLFCGKNIGKQLIAVH